MLRVRLDGLPPHLFVRTPTSTAGLILKYEPSEDAYATQQMFLTMFGGGLNVSKKVLPRRKRPRTESTDVKVGHETVASLKRKRAAQLSQLDGVPTDAAELRLLEQQAAESAELRKGPSYTKFIQSLNTLADRKRKRMAEDPMHFKDVDFQRALRKEAELHEAIQAIRSAPMGVQDTALDTVGTVVLCNSAASVEKLDAVAALGLRCMVFTNTVEEYRRLLPLPARKLVWYVEKDSDFVLPSNKEPVTPFLLASRILGGYVGTNEWAKCCSDNGRLLAPPLRLASFADRKVQLLGIFLCSAVMPARQGPGLQALRARKGLSP